jgi:predicted transcriptional regulator
MRSVRLDDTLESRLEEAARLEGKPVSSIIREAIEKRCEVILGQGLAHRLRDIAGVVRGGGGRARKTGAAFRAALRKRRAKR